MRVVRLSTMPKIEKKIKLDLSGVPTSDKADAKEAVGDYLLNELRRYLKEGRSIVKGHGPFKKLTKHYAQEEKAGDTTPNLQDKGDYLHAHDFKINQDDSITYGVFKEKELGKADGHNQFTAKAKAHAKKFKMPERRTVPKGAEKFKAQIEKGIKRIVAEYEVEADDIVSEATVPVPSGSDPVTTAIIIDELFETEEELLLRLML